VPISLPQQLQKQAPLHGDFVLEVTAKSAPLYEQQLQNKPTIFGLNSSIAAFSFQRVCLTCNRD